MKHYYHSVFGLSTIKIKNIAHKKHPPMKRKDGGYKEIKLNNGGKSMF